MFTQTSGVNEVYKPFLKKKTKKKTINNLAFGIFYRQINTL